MRLLGLDIGEARVGVALSDACGTVALPRAVLDGRELVRDLAPLRAIVEADDVTGLVVGLPVGMNGVEGAQAARVRACASRWAAELGLTVVFFDERLTSVEASRSMHAAGADTKRQRGRLDMVAATLILQGYLDSQRGDVPKDDDGA
ncbi:MAG: Holliday junction resolvase RuvX [Coriobacteriales bacterium]